VTLSRSVQTLSNLLRAHIATVRDDPPLVAWVDEIATMPRWLRESRLDLWEHRVKTHAIDWAERESLRDPLFELAAALFELGANNLYGRINQPQTLHEFLRVRSLFEQAGIENLPSASDFDFGTW
jgi:hypothetical protein